MTFMIFTLSHQQKTFMKKMVGTQTVLHVIVGTMKW